MKKVVKNNLIGCAFALSCSLIAAGGAATHEAFANEAVGAKVAVNETISFTTGASIRVDTEETGVTGVRYAANIPAELYNTVIENGVYKSDKTELGMMIVPAKAFTMFARKSTENDYFKYFASLDASNSKENISSAIPADKYNQKGDGYQVQGVIELKPENYNVEYQAAVYYTTDGETYTYSPLSSERSITYVAKEALNDKNSGLSGEQKAKLTEIVSAYAPVVSIERNGEITGYASLQGAFSESKAKDIITLNEDITLTSTAEPSAEAVRNGITLNGNGHTITLDCAGKTGIRFGHDSSENKNHVYATGSTIKNLTIQGTAGIGLHLHGGTTTAMENVVIKGSYSSLAVNFYGTHGGVLTNCDFSNDVVNSYVDVSVFANCQSKNQIVLNNSNIDRLYINGFNSTYANNGVKLIVNEGSHIGNLINYEKGAYYQNNGATIDNILYSITDSQGYNTGFFQTAENEYAILNASGLQYFANLVNEGKTFAGKTVKLISDINLSGIAFTPIGTSKAISFQGTFDGNGYSIKSATIHAYTLETTGTVYGGGLFGNINNATIKNLTIENADVNSGVYRNETQKALKGNIFGILSGYAYGTTTIENVTITESKVSAFGKVGAFVGYLPEGTLVFKNCKAIKTIVEGVYNCAGLCGTMAGSIVIENCNVDGVEFVSGNNEFENHFFTGKETLTVGGRTGSFVTGDNGTYYCVEFAKYYTQFNADNGKLGDEIPYNEAENYTIAN